PLTRSHPAVARNGLVYFTEGGLLLARPATPLPPDPPLSAPEPGVRRLTQPSGDGFSIWNAVALGSRGFAVLGRAFSAGTLPGARPIPPDTVVVATYTREGTLGASVQEPLGGFLSPPPWILASPDGSRLDMANGGVLTRYDATLESPLLRAPFPYPALAVSAAGELLVSGANSPPAPAPTLDGFSPSASLAWSWPLSGGVTIVAAAFGAGGDAVAAGAFPDPTAPMYSQPVSRPRSGFVGAFPRTGAPAWLRPLPGVLPEALVTDPAGNAYLAATSAGAFDVGRGPEVVPQPGVSAVILAKYAPDGSVTWVRLFPRCASPQLAIAANGTLAIAVRGDLDPSGTAPEGSISPTVSIGVLAADGTPTWVEHAGDTWPQGLSVYPDGHTLTVEGLPDGAGAVVERGPQ
ncbi:MAG: hypothetical protein FJ104_03315, partial [Deltaproteobacteria bacterium]|nr:hypothetical protein [Deltaproteobacteria bacterium]